MLGEDRAAVATLSAPFARLGAATRELLCREDEPCSLEELRAQAVFLAHTVDMLKVEEARLLQLIAEKAELEEDETDWFRHAARVSVSEAQAIRAVGRNMGDLQESTRALLDGSIGFGHLVHMAHNSDFDNRHVGEFNEAPLLELAKAQSVSRFRYTCRDYRHAQTPSGVLNDEVEAVEARDLWFNQREDGRYHIGIDLDSAGYLAARTALEARSTKFGPEDTRDAGRRRCDGFIDMCTADLAAKGRPGETLAPVHISVTTSIETLQGLPGSPCAHTEYGVTLPSATVQRLACDAAITQVLLDGKLLPVGVSATKRKLTKRERQALRQMYPTCGRPGCQRPASQCEAHHIYWWSKGGKTVIGNMILLCPFHHWQLHEGGWQMAKSEEDGEFIWIPPQNVRGPTSSFAA